MTTDNEILDIDELFDRDVNHEAVDAIYRRTLDPAGTYQTDPDESPVTIAAFRRDEKNPQGEVTGQRLMIRVSGKGTTRTKDGDDHSAYLGFNMSPEPREKKEYVDQQWTGDYVAQQDDLPTRLWAQAVKLYAKVKGEAPKKESDVIRFVQESPVGLRCMQGDNGLVVLNIVQAR